MEVDISYAIETRTKTRNLGLVMSVLLIPVVLGFMYIDHVTPSLQGIVGWRIGALIPFNSQAASPISSSRFTSVVVTREPFALRNFAVALPVRARPTTNTFLPFRSIYFAMPL